MTLVLLYDGIKVGAVKESGLTIHVPPALVLGVAALEFTETLFPPIPGNKEILCNVWNNYSWLLLGPACRMGFLRTHWVFKLFFKGKHYGYHIM
jgi:hypothetical protein